MHFEKTKLYSNLVYARTNHVILVKSFNFIEIQFLSTVENSNNYSINTNCN